MALNKILYPLDFTGVSKANHISDETHVIGVDRYRAFALNYGPFFTDSVVIVDIDKHRRLDRGVDYEFVYTIPELIKMSQGKEVAGVIVITNKSVGVNLQISYNIVGGHYASNVYVINKAIEDLKLDDRNAYWKNILDKPELFQPAPHDHDFGDVYGFEYIISVLNSINDVVVAGNSQVTDTLQENLNKAVEQLTNMINEHNARRDNPHEVTAHQTNAFTREEVNEFLDGIAKRFEALEPRISEIIKSIATNLEKIDANKQAIGTLGERIGVTEKTYAGFLKIIATLNERCDDILKDIEAINESIETLKLRDKELEGMIEDSGKLIEEVNKRIDSVYNDFLAQSQQTGEALSELRRTTAGHADELLELRNKIKAIEEGGGGGGDADVIEDLRNKITSATLIANQAVEQNLIQDERLDAFGNKLTELESVVGGFNDTISSASELANEAKAAADAAKEAAEAASSKANTNSNSIQTINQAIQTINSSLSTLTERVESISNSGGDTAQEVADVKRDLNDYKNAVNTALNKKYDKTGGLITGNVQVRGGVRARDNVEGYQPV